MSDLAPLSISPFSPLRTPLFRSLWIASLVSNIGTLAQTVGQGWLMTSLTVSPILIALVQAAESLPVFFFALPAGALADLVHRRSLLLLTQTWMLLVAAVLGAATLLGWTTAPLLLTAAFLLSAGAALNAPAWQATMPDIVDRKDLPLAISLNAIGYNLARVVGPAVGGLAVAAAGPGAAFLLNALSFLAVIAVLLRWKSTQPERLLPAERMIGAMRTGVRYLQNSSAVQAVLVRVGIFIFFSSSLWALLPLYARQVVQVGSLGYGILLTSLGAGAVMAAVLLPKLRRRLRREQILSGATLLYAAALLVLSRAKLTPWICLSLVGAGTAWLTTMSSFNVATQTSVPAWIRARALSFYLLVFQGGMAIGSVFWGTVASRYGVTHVYAGAGVGLALTLAIARRWELPSGENLDFSPSVRWPELGVSGALGATEGPVLVTVRYRVASENRERFKAVMHEVGGMRKRTGAFEWGLFFDPTEREVFLEVFFVETWTDHLRQHERITVADRQLVDAARSFHVDKPGEPGPAVSHLVYAYEPRRFLPSLRF